MTAYGYIRKSVVHDPTRMLSPEMQEDAIRALAAKHGDEDVAIYSDLDVSGRKGRTKRPGWDEVMRAVESGECHAVYAYSLSRFARSVAQLAEFFDLCDAHGVRVRVERDHIDTSTATGKLMTNVLASLAQFEADVSSERVKDAFAAKRRADPEWTGPGQPDYGRRAGEDAQVIVEAFREAGSFDGAARLLNEQGIPCRVKGAAWTGGTVARIVRRVAPDAVPPAVTRGAPAGTRSFRLARVLVCSVCGTYLTGSKDTRDGHVRYQCRRARTVPHPRAWVAETMLLPVIAREVERAAVAVKRAQAGSAQDEATMKALAEKRARIVDMFQEGIIDKVDRDRRLAEVADSESKLETRRWVKRLAVPPLIEPVEVAGAIVPADSPARVNDYLRRLLVNATVDMSQPTRKGRNQPTPALTFEWRDPSMRTDDDAVADAE